MALIIYAPASQIRVGASKTPREIDKTDGHVFATLVFTAQAASERVATIYATPDIHICRFLLVLFSIETCVLTAPAASKRVAITSATPASDFCRFLFVRREIVTRVSTAPAASIRVAATSTPLAIHISHFLVLPLAFESRRCVPGRLFEAFGTLPGCLAAPFGASTGAPWSLLRVSGGSAGPSGRPWVSMTRIVAPLAGHSWPLWFLVAIFGGARSKAYRC